MKSYTISMQSPCQVCWKAQEQKSSSQRPLWNYLASTFPNVFKFPLTRGIRNISLYKTISVTAIKSRNIHHKLVYFISSRHHHRLQLHLHSMATAKSPHTTTLVIETTCCNMKGHIGLGETEAEIGILWSEILMDYTCRQPEHQRNTQTMSSFHYILSTKWQ